MPHPSQQIEVPVLINDILLSQLVDFKSSVNFTYSLVLLDAVWLFNLSWSTKYRCFQTLSPVLDWSSELLVEPSSAGLWNCEEVPEGGMSSKCGELSNKRYFTLLYMTKYTIIFILEFDSGFACRTNVPQLILTTRRCCSTTLPGLRHWHIGSTGQYHDGGVSSRFSF